MRGLTDIEREILANGTGDDVCTPSCFPRRWMSEDPPRFVAAEALISRGLLEVRYCARGCTATIAATTTLGRIALRADAVARGLEVLS